MADHIKLFVYESDIRHTKKERIKIRSKKSCVFHNPPSEQYTKQKIFNEKPTRISSYIVYDYFAEMFFPSHWIMKSERILRLLRNFGQKTFPMKMWNILKNYFTIFTWIRRGKKPLHIESLNFRNCFPTIVQKTPSLKISICKKKNENSFMLYASTPISLNSEKNFFSVIVFEGILGKWGFLENKKSFE